MTVARWLGLGICLAPAVSALLTGATAGVRALYRKATR